MEQKEFPHLRLYVLGGIVLLVLFIYLGVLYDTQINDHEDYLAQSIRTITQPETVEGSRGIVTDCNGQVLVSNRSTYSLTFSSSLLKEGEDMNQAVLRLTELCQDRGVDWVDNLPVSSTAPFSYTLDNLDSIQQGRFLTYLLSLDAVTEPVSLFEPLYSDSGDTVCVMDQVRDRKNTDEQWLERIALKDAMARLGDRERHILALRFYEGKTQMEVSNEVGISQAQVSRLEKNALNTIRKNI